LTVDRLLSREAFVALVAHDLDLAPSVVAGDGGRPWAPDPVALLRIDELVSRELGIELPETALAPAADVDSLYRAYALEHVATDLRASGTVQG
jgi:hypothetical protein